MHTNSENLQHRMKLRTRRTYNSKCINKQISATTQTKLHKFDNRFH